MSADSNAVTTQILREQWQYFAEPEVPGAVDLTVCATKADVLSGVDRREASLADDVEYGDNWAYVPKYEFAIARQDDRWFIGSDRETGRLSSVLLDYLLLDRGLALIHSAAVELDDGAVLLSGWGGVGKTSALARLILESGARFMADDWAFVTAAGTVMSLPKPMYIYTYHQALYPHLFHARHKPLIPQRLARPVKASRKIVRPFFERFPRFEGFARRWSPEHMKVMPDRAFPDSPIRDEARLGCVLFVERVSAGRVHLREIDLPTLTQRMSAVMYHDHASSSRELALLLGGAGVMPLATMPSVKVDLLSSAFSGVPTAVLSIPRTSPHEDVGMHVLNAYRDLK